MVNQFYVKWIADEYKKQERDLGWYAGLFLFGAILILWSLYTNNIIATILFLLVILIIYALSHRHPDKVLVELSHKGVSLNGVLYRYRDFKHFWILHHEDGGPQLNFETSSLFNRHITIELENQDPEEIREYLKTYVEEIADYEENFVDYLLRKLKL